MQAAGGVTALINMASKHDDSALVQVRSLQPYPCPYTLTLLLPLPLTLSLTPSLPLTLPLYMVQAQFAGVLRDLCISDEIALEIHQARIVSIAIVSIAVVSASPTRSPSRSTRRTAEP